MKAQKGVKGRKVAFNFFPKMIVSNKLDNLKDTVIARLGARGENYTLLFPAKLIWVNQIYLSLLWVFLNRLG